MGWLVLSLLLFKYFIFIIRNAPKLTYSYQEVKIFGEDHGAICFNGSGGEGLTQREERTGKGKRREGVQGLLASKL